jgi:hypothetical protein
VYLHFHSSSVFSASLVSTGIMVSIAFNGGYIDKPHAYGYPD